MALGPLLQWHHQQPGRLPSPHPEVCQCGITCLQLLTEQLYGLKSDPVYLGVSISMVPTNLESRAVLIWVPH
jgi:hypothetical protein